MQKLSDEEWVALMKERQDPRHEVTEAAEWRGYRGDRPVLAAKKQFENQPLGDRSISVIRGTTVPDLQRMYDGGVAGGNGNEERAMYRDHLATWDERDHAWQEEILKLSSFGRMCRETKGGYSVQLAEPELIAEEIQWVWDHVVA